MSEKDWARALESMEKLREHVGGMYDEYLTKCDGDVERAYSLTIGRLQSTYMMSILRADSEEKVSAIIINVIGLAVHSTVKAKDNG